jgi:hypothetical protein
MTSAEALGRSRAEHFFLRRQPQIFFFGSQDSYRQGYLHDLRRENDQKNSSLNQHFENGNWVIKKWFNTPVNNLFTGSL